MRICDRCDTKHAFEVAIKCDGWEQTMDLCEPCRRLLRSDALTRALYIFRNDKSHDVFNEEIRRLNEVVRNL